MIVHDTNNVFLLINNQYFIKDSKAHAILVQLRSKISCDSSSFSLEAKCPEKERVWGLPDFAILK